MLSTFVEELPVPWLVGVDTWTRNMSADKKGVSSRLP